MKDYPTTAAGRRSAGNVRRLRQIKRLLGMLLLMSDSHRGYSTNEIAERMGVHVRTARRDVLALQDIGFPLYHEMESREEISDIRVWRIRKGWLKRFM